MTAYQLTPVGAEGVEGHRAEVIDIPTYLEALQQIERLKDYLEAARLDVDTYRRMWELASAERVKAETRSVRSFRVLASIGRMSPLAAALVERCRVEVYGELP
jgi:hypothetical protein